VKYAVHLIDCAKDVREYDAERDICASEERGNGVLEELLDLHSSPNNIRVIKLRRKRWEGHVARVKEKRGEFRFWWGKLREVGHLEDLGVDGTIALKWILKK
jgi:hypothetical protein